MNLNYLLHVLFFYNTYKSSIFSSSSLPTFCVLNKISNNSAIPLFLQKGQQAIEFELNVHIFLSLTTWNKFWLSLNLAWSCRHLSLFSPLLPSQCPLGVLQVLQIKSSCFVWMSIFRCQTAKVCDREDVQPARQTGQYPRSCARLRWARQSAQVLVFMAVPISPPTWCS